MAVRATTRPAAALGSATPGRAGVERRLAHREHAGPGAYRVPVVECDEIEAGGSRRATRVSPVPLDCAGVPGHRPLADGSSAHGGAHQMNARATMPMSSK